MAGLKAKFSMASVRQAMNIAVDEHKRKTIEVLQYAGEEFVNKARSNKTYVDDTGNLRSSIGYVILDNGKVVDRSFVRSREGYTDGSEGVTAAWNTVNELARDFPVGVVLIGVAGMNYAAAVESLGFDVITGASPQSKDVKDFLSEIKF